MTTDLPDANEVAGKYLPDQQVCVVVNQGNAPMFDYGQAFIGVMAHEVCHVLHHIHTSRPRHSLMVLSARGGEDHE